MRGTQGGVRWRLTSCGSQCTAGIPRCELEKDVLASRWTKRQENESRTKSVVVADLGPPAPDEVDFVFLHAGHPGVPLADEVDVLVHLVWFDGVEDDGVDVLATGEDLGEGLFDILIEFLAFLGPVDQRGQRTPPRRVSAGLPFFPYNAMG